jgi:hypothetical protein
MLDNAPTWTRRLSCADCDSELFQEWEGADMRFFITHSPTCPTGHGPERRVRLVISDAAPGRESSA